jgi:hypothetical protein
VSNDTTDRFPPDGPRDTNPMLEEILATVRELRGLPAAVDELGARLSRLETKIDGIARDLRNELGGTRDVFRKELGLESNNARELIADLDRRVRAIEERKPAP